MICSEVFPNTVWIRGPQPPGHSAVPGRGQHAHVQLNLHEWQAGVCAHAHTAELAQVELHVCVGQYATRVS